MKRMILCFVAITLLFPMIFSLSSAGEKAYEEGSVWSITMVRTGDNMGDKYVEDLSKYWGKIMDEAKNQGIILSYKILWGSSANPDDYDMLLMVEIQNYAAIDGFYDKIEPIMMKIFTSDEAMDDAGMKREKLREIFGDKLMQEIHLK